MGSMDLVVQSTVLSTLKAGRNFTLTGKEKFSSDFFKISPIAESLLHKACSGVAARAASAEEGVRKVILRGAYAALSGVEALSFYIMEAGSPKLFYPVGKAAFFPIDVPSEGFYIHGREVLTFDPYFASACRYGISERVDRDILFFPIKKNETYLGMLIAEGQAGKELAFDCGQFTGNGSCPVSEEGVKLLLNYFAAVATLYSLIMNNWFNRLTGLLNRNCFEREIYPSMSHWLEKGMQFTVLLLDLDKFKAINDKYGHSAGDEVLKKVGETLIQSTKSTSALSGRHSEYPDFVVRWGGDEFIGILQNTTCESAIKIVRRLQDEISRIRYKELSISASVGMLDSAYLMKKMKLGTFDMFEEIDRLLYTSKDQRGSLSYVDASSSLKCVQLTGKQR